MASNPTPGVTGPAFEDRPRFVRAPDALWRELAGVTLVRTVDLPDVVELWGTGVLLWAALVEPASADELGAELAAVTGAPVDVVTGDVREALADLWRRRVVVVAEA